MGKRCCQRRRSTDIQARPDEFGTSCVLFWSDAIPTNQPGGTNFATSGAKNVAVNNGINGGFTAAVPTVTQINNYLAASGGRANPSALYLISTGGNDVTFATGGSGSGPFPVSSTPI